MAGEYIVECPNKNYDLYLKEYKEIPLTRGKVTLVDIEDYDELSKYKWYCHKAGYKYYAGRMDCLASKFVYMHRAILKPSYNKQIDHINRDGLDNRRENLRLCSKIGNSCNKTKPSHNKSGYKGVSWIKDRRKWYACIIISSKTISLGRFNTKEAAALAYNEAAIKYNGEFAYLNVLTEES